MPQTGLYWGVNGQSQFLGMIYTMRFAGSRGGILVVVPSLVFEADVDSGSLFSWRGVVVASITWFWVGNCWFSEEKGVWGLNPVCGIPLLDWAWGCSGNFAGP